ncbi:hypothetical protein KP509_04G042500 [Ceratopteris richardii]|uniref:PsbP C-terminal domain-containing protein n=1 Tax=Ceratopteris richardii TaxID=49495 RepID=A0A8T2USE4_CERRI|nr:hypothetical protein KP509_04G042500 [Ceratopteris richardii]
MAMVLDQSFPWSRYGNTFTNRKHEPGGFSLKRGKLSHMPMSITWIQGVSRVKPVKMDVTFTSFATPSVQRLDVCETREDQALCGRRADRRTMLALLLGSAEALWRLDTAMATDEKANFPLVLESYVDEKEGFSLLKPTSWSKIEKAGASVLFEDPESKGNNVGVVVNPVRISSLRDFGNVEIVANKLLQAEKKKGTTNDVQLIKTSERQANRGVPLYQLEYKLDSARGIKRILSAVTVASKKLYILNVAYADSPDKPLQPEMIDLLEQIVNSFDIL